MGSFQKIAIVLSILILIFSLEATQAIARQVHEADEKSDTSFILPYDQALDEAAVVGAETCGTSGCHNSSQTWPNSAVEQNEYIKWRQFDPHSQSYSSLTQNKAKDIVERMGLASSAYETKLCLDCHSFNVDTPSGGNLKVENGVSCEVCHGPGESWIGVHTAGLFFYEENIKSGMFPTTNPEARSELCMSCHIGTKDKLVTHNMLAAGHPRLSFELNFYTWFSSHEIEDSTDYAHFNVDADYRQRKPLPYGARVWAIGQVKQAKRSLDLVLTPELHAGLTPELSLFNCDSCHQPLSEDKIGNSRGYPKLNSSNLNSLILINRVIDQKSSEKLKLLIEKTHEASEKSWPKLQSAAAQLNLEIETLLSLVRTHKFSTRDRLKIIELISARSPEIDIESFQSAEQIFLAVGSIIDELYRGQEISLNDFERLKALINQKLKLIDSSPSYDPNVSKETLANIQLILSKYQSERPYFK